MLAAKNAISSIFISVFFLSFEQVVVVEVDVFVGGKERHFFHIYFCVFFIV